MSNLLFSISDLCNEYKSWISKNPQTASDLETTAKWLSYFVAGRINNSHVVSELVYCLSNLLVLYNDRIINNVRHLELPSSGDRLKLWLTVVEYSEVFFELSANKLWGNRGRWLIIISVQLFKCLSRLLLIFHHKETIIQNPPIQALERRTVLIKNTNNTIEDTTNAARAHFESISFKLKHSGRFVRKVESSPPIGMRIWKPVQQELTDKCDNEQTLEQALTGRQLIAETIYVFKPVIHLSSMACFGSRTWKPWMVSLVLDLLSLHLYKTCKTTKVNPLTYKQKLQISRRTISLLLYLIRSPFYERHSKDRINDLLQKLSNSIPLAGLVCLPLAQYLPFWQSNYFYMWST